MNLEQFYKGKKVFITGHTGFKGSWMCKVLLEMGAEVTGYSLLPTVEPNLFQILHLEKQINTQYGDIRDICSLQKAVTSCQPEIVFHLAAQPIVREAYNDPVNTYEVNVLGTVNLLESIRHSKSIKSVVNITTDKVYKNNEWEWGYRESDELCGYDPYSNSKSCSELVTESYKNSFLNKMNIAVTTARAGNVIGGGDFAKDRIIPDCVRAIMENRNIIIRNPYSTRPYQHVLESIFAYLLIAAMQYDDIKISGNYNIGPEENGCLTTGKLVSLFCEKWKVYTGKILTWENEYEGGPHEANLLKLDCSKAKTKLAWKPIWRINTAVEKVVEWIAAYLQGTDISQLMTEQITEYMTQFNRSNLTEVS